MAVLNSDSPRGLLVNLLIIFAILALLIFSFFYIYLPISTNHGESITVPNIVGMDYEEVQDFLEERDLNFFVKDSSYSAEYKPYAVLKQYPLAGSKVKENRKIYISLNSKTAPKVKMPKLTENSLKSAQIFAQSVGLKISKVDYVPSQYHNFVLKQMVNGREIKEGEFIPKGTSIQVQVGNGLGKDTEISIPDVVGEDYKFDEAEFILIGQGLRVGNVEYVESDREPFTVIRQYPEPNSGKINLGGSIDLWVAKSDSASAE